jgi:transcriptional regulator with XRE-family HTH domain
MQAISQKKPVFRKRPYNGRMASGRTTDKKAPFFGQRLSYFRKKRGMTQQEFADALGISRSLVHHYERSCPNPTTDFVLKATQTLDVSLDEFFELKPEKEKSGPSPKALKIAERISTLPRAKQSIVVGMLEGAIEQVS